jgi:hypothetical protein
MAASLWPWLAVAGAGAFHGLNPASGWACAAAWGLRSRSRATALRALLPIAVGHAASVALAAAAVLLGVSVQRGVLLGLSAGLLVVAVAMAFRGRAAGRLRAPAGQVGMALWSFVMATAHGGGWMLLPALVPLCMGHGPAREIGASGSLMLALAAVTVHTAAMLGVTALLASGVCRGFDAVRGCLSADAVFESGHRTTGARLRDMLGSVLSWSARCSHALQPRISTRNCSFFSMPTSMATWTAGAFSARRRSSPRSDSAPPACSRH